MKKHTIITGASTGLGRAFAIAFAQRGHHLVLVALPNEDLDKLAHQISEEYEVNVDFYEADLSILSSIENLYSWLNSKQININFLVNNAGIGGSKLFQETDNEQLDNIIQLNVKGTTILTRTLLPMLMQHSTSYILNVSSIAAFSPLPYKMVYPATKAFIHSFSLGLKSELAHKGVNVSVVNPGSMPTNKDILQRIKSQEWLGKISFTNPEYVAQKAIEGIFAGKSVIVPGFINQINYWLFRVLPWSIIEPIASRTIRREIIHQ